MGVAWITDIYQNYQPPIFIRSRDDVHNGIVNGEDLNDRRWHALEHGVYTTSWFGVPWFYLNENNHYKIISLSPLGMETQDQTLINGVRLYTSVFNGQDNICYVDQRGTTFARTALSNGTDTNCKLVFGQDGGFYIEPINTGNPDPFTILNTAGEVIKATIDMVLKVTELALTVAAETTMPVSLQSIDYH